MTTRSSVGSGSAGSTGSYSNAPNAKLGVSHLLKFVAKPHVPVECIEDENLIAALRALYPPIEIPSRMTVRRRLIARAEELRSVLVAKLKSAYSSRKLGYLNNYVHRCEV